MPNEEKQYGLFSCESRAYCRLKARGICDRGSIPDFYGVIRDIEPLANPGWQQHLQCFADEPQKPNATLIEYIPSIRMIDLSNFSHEKVEKLKSILAEIHEAWVLHGDNFPRNMMVQDGTGRPLWIDFDRAQTYMPGVITERQRGWFTFEREYIEEFAEFLERDFQNGKIKETYFSYYG
ncbi:hypothetical protein LTR66_017414 [Elasticomyces elasticus]|nr:hypothetical protein LTR66_017414 [Elasticomyces elasticus]